jgi:flavin reductase (DIM6/NTAB) family NADH-FMN oxidoreductase RutF
LPIDPADFKRALGQFATGVAVVTTRVGDGKPLGLTVSAFASVSLDPPLVLVCIDNRSEAIAGLEATGVFGVSVLAEGQEAFSRRFAVPGHEKFLAKDLHLGDSGVALIPHALAHIECRVAAAHAAGDHTIYVGEVLRLAAWPGRPLLYHASAYRRLDREAGSID